MRIFKFIFYGSLVAGALILVFYFKQDRKAEAVQQENAEVFHAIHVQGVFEVHLWDTEDTWEYGIETTDKTLEKIEAYVSHGTLYLKSKKGFPGNWDKVVVNISAPDLDKIHLSGAAELTSENTLTYGKVEMITSGASDADLDIEAQSMIIRNSGAADLSLKGKVSEMDIRVSGAGEIDADNLEVERMKLEISGAGHAFVDVREHLDVSVSGAGSVSYQGNPQINQSVSGVGSVHKVD